MSRVHSILLSRPAHCLLAAAGWIPGALAQNVAVSATAAWSQIVAFWGAVGIGVRSSSGLQSTNAFTSIFASLSAFWRARAVMSALRCGEWYLLSPGYSGGSIRLDVVLICWSTPPQLWQACLQVAILAEVVGLQRWLVLVVGCQVAMPHITQGAYWTQSPRHSDFCTTRFADSMGSIYSPFANEDRFQAIVHHYYAASMQGQPNDNPNFINTIAHLQCEEALEVNRPTRCATRNEAPVEVQEATGLGRHFTSYQIEGVTIPYVSVQKVVSNFAASRRAVVSSSAFLYCIVHTMVCVAVGLMGAASGRGLAVWFFTPRMVMSKREQKQLQGMIFCCPF
ncbi:hypothetical protein L7F22_065939 [Adiantum nelumboides]|nr:hypothetical protein [Adiantum nelumboides]